LLGQEGEVPGCSISGTDFLPVGCFGGTIVVAATEGIASGIDVDVDVDSGAGATVPEGDSV
jgi:hypothetical protein